MLRNVERAILGDREPEPASAFWDELGVSASAPQACAAGAVNHADVIASGRGGSCCEGGGALRVFGWEDLPVSESTASCKNFILRHPVAHSKSPAMYNALYARLGLPWSYDFMDCPTVEQAERFVAARGFRSINVTTPYKPLAFEAATARFLGEAREGRQRAGRQRRRADRLQRRRPRLHRLSRARGRGFLRGARGCVRHRPTALSILHAAALAGAAEVTMVGRDKERSRAVLEEYASMFATLASTAIGMPAANERHLSFGQAYDHVSLKFGSYTTSTRAIAAADVVIDATPLGMKQGDPAPFDVDLIGPDQVVFDVVYGHGETALVSAARAAGPLPSTARACWSLRRWPRRASCAISPSRYEPVV